MHDWIMKAVLYDREGTWTSFEMLTDDLFLIERDPGYLSSNPQFAELPSETRTDLGDTKTWTQYVQKFDFDGVMKSQKITCDTGVGETRQFEDSVMVYRALTDWGNDLRSWDHITYDFDPDTGQLVLRNVFNDDGVVRFEAYEDGVPRRVTEGDSTRDNGAHAWTERDRHYDENGRPTLATVRKDDGGETESRWLDGELSFRMDSRPDGAFNWASRSLKYENAIISEAQIIGRIETIVEMSFYGRSAVLEIGL